MHIVSIDQQQKMCSLNYYYYIFVILKIHIFVFDAVSAKFNSFFYYY